MSKIRLFLLFSLIFFTLGGTANIAHAEINSGFVNGLWYSQTPFFADQTVRIYTAIHNNNTFDIRGVVEFQDGDQTIGTSNFTVLSGRTEEAWADWKATYGDHRLSATLTKTEKLEIGHDPMPMNWNSATPSDKIFVDHAPNTPTANVAPTANAAENSNIASSLDNFLNDQQASTSSNSNTLVAGEKIKFLSDTLNALKQFSEKGKVITAQLRSTLESQQPNTTVSSTSSTGGIILSDIPVTPSLWSKIYHVVLNILILILKLPPLILAIGVAIILFLISRSMYRFYRWRTGRY